ncbi:dipeptidyl-peptidase-3 [Dysgonomonas sp. PH5-45]|uniref:dipeptidyl-peptidase 3 family protein n=1 Tax=unclassified Dysgonomonas TaxID=2630389 RepID=UPI0024733DAB|nr:MULTISPECIES: dihydrofolate reductase [unclassified Dysgonomonas]MDH6355552.1 dipeptidyl-peptidase-3 [Dysgonomonas sp. PH5-45]MDH6388449.1 dipeptidyl-peptidase-3 [Dysgonomonas sp. PH5-37]
MKKTALIAMTGLSMMFAACSGGSKTEQAANEDSDFVYEVDAFADLEILRYQVSDFDSLTLQQKEMIYYLSQAAIEGRDILFDQNGRYNLAIRRTLEAIYENYKGDKESNDYKEFEVYLKRVWFSNGIHHHYGEEKFLPKFSEEFFAEQVKALPAEKVPVKDGQTVDEFIAMLTPVMFDPNVMAKKVNQAAGVDIILTSANNYYGEGVTQKEAEAFYTKMRVPNDQTPVSYGLNSRLVKEDGQLVEKVWKVGGLYSSAIERIIGWLEKAKAVAENDKQKDVINKLISFYQSGDLKMFDNYAIAWATDTDSRVDFVNGFTETYGDPLGMKASWESIVNFKNMKATKRTELISSNAQWFEDHSPVDTRFKKKEVKGVSAKVITAAQLGGDCYPATPIGINLPNADWIRKEHGSKSVTIENLMEAYDKAAQHSGFNEEFVWSDVELNSLREYGFITNNLHTDLHEILGHGSGQLLPGISSDAMKEHGSTIEETRADLFGLYYIADAKLVELGIIPNKDAYKAEYYKFMMNGLMTQLTRIEPGKNIEEAHMRNRQLIARWVLEKGKGQLAGGTATDVVELKVRDGKTYVVINDYEKLRGLFGELLAEIQRIKSEGDYKAANNIVNAYAVKVDQKLLKEVLDRYKKLNLKPYKGFVNPVYELVKDKDGKITDIKVTYKEGYVEQMMRYSKEFSSLPTYND